MRCGRSCRRIALQSTAQDHRRDSRLTVLSVSPRPNRRWPRARATPVARRPSRCRGSSFARRHRPRRRARRARSGRRRPSCAPPAWPLPLRPFPIRVGASPGDRLWSRPPCGTRTRDSRGG